MDREATLNAKHNESNFYLVRYHTMTIKKKPN